MSYIVSFIGGGMVVFGLGKLGDALGLSDSKRSGFVWGGLWLFWGVMTVVASISK